MIANGLTVLLLLLSAVFFTAGTVGLLRFPDTLTRVHALTKADNLGLGCLVAGLAVQADSLAQVAKLGLIWVLALTVGASAGYLIARHSTAVRSDSQDD